MKVAWAPFRLSNHSRCALLTRNSRDLATIQTRPINDLRRRAAAANLSVFSGRGENPHRRYADFDPRARERSLKPDFSEVSRSGERPEPTVIVRMKENGWS